MKTFRHLSSQLYLSDKPLYFLYSACNSFVRCVQCRLPFRTTFPTSNTVYLEFSYSGHEYCLYLSFSEYEELLVYSFMHIDDDL